MCHLSLSRSGDNNTVSLSQNPLKSLASKCDQLKIIYSQYPDISESFKKLGASSEANLKHLWNAHLAEQKLVMMLQSIPSKYLEIDPTEQETAIQEQAKDLDAMIMNLETSYLETIKEIDKIPLENLLKGAGKVYEDQTLEIKYLQGEARSCSNQHRALLAEFDKVSLLHTKSIEQIEEFEKLIQFRKKALDKNNARLEELEREFEEALKKSEAELQGIKDGYETDYREKNKAALESSKQKIAMLDEKLKELEMKVAELRAAQSENYESIVLQLEEEMSAIRNQKGNELGERDKNIQALKQFYDQKTASVQDDSLFRKQKDDLLQDLQEKRSSLLNENDKTQLKISDLRSKQNEIPIFTSQRDDLEKRSALQKKECDDLQEKRSKKIEERDAFAQNESHEVSVLKQRELIKESEAFGDYKQTLIDFMNALLNTLKLKKFIIENSLKHSGIKSLQENIELKADLYLDKVYNRPKECQEIVDCFQEIFTEKFSKKQFDTKLPLSSLLEVTLIGTKGVSSILKGEDFTISKETEDLLRAKMLSHKESAWTFTSLLQSFLKLFGSELHSFVKVEEKEFQNEKNQAQAILNLATQDVKKEFKRFIPNKWKENIEEMTKNFIDPSSANNFAALS